HFENAQEKIAGHAEQHSGDAADESKKKSFQDEDFPKSPAVYAQGAQGAQLAHPLDYSGILGVVNGEDYEHRKKNKNEYENDPEHPADLIVERPNLRPRFHFQIEFLFLKQYLQPLRHRRRIGGFLEQNEHGRDTQRLARKEQSGGMPNVQFDHLIVELFCRARHESTHPERDHVRETTLWWLAD